MIVYNEIDGYAASWLENLSKKNLINPGVVDRRSIADVTAEDVAKSTQAHFFAGIGIWSYALRLAGWPDDLPVWTGSCPCQPFSQAGKRGGVADERHLWPEWFRLIRECLPPIVFGEQVASKDGLGWLDTVQTDMESAGYAFAAFDLCAPGVGAPHIRQRLYFVGVAIAEDLGLRTRIRGALSEAEARSRRSGPEHSRRPGGLADDDDDEGCREFGSPRLRADGDAPQRHNVDGRGPACGLGDDDDEGSQGRRISAQRAGELFAGAASLGRFWSGADWLYCQDEKIRPVEPGTFPLAHGAPNRVGRIRAYGNGLVAPLAATFIRSVMEIL